jgi:hypothetical protein
MVQDSALRSLLGESVIPLEPLAILREGIYVKSDQSSDSAAYFVTAMGVEHPLRLLFSRQAFDEQLVRLNADTVGRYIRAGMSRARTDSLLDDLRYFVESLVPSFQERDWSEHFVLDAFPAPAVPRFVPDVGERIDELSRAFPTLALPSPSYLLLGRFRMLRPDPAPAGVDHVRCGRETLVPTTETHFAWEVERRWRASVSTFVESARERLLEAAADVPAGPAVIAARQEIARTGCVECGDLVFLAGPPSRVGHILPPHHNRMLGRLCERDVAMMAPLTRPPRLEVPKPYVRDSLGRWSSLPLRNGVCLGGSPPDPRPETAGLALLAYLRWAACRVASNGAFHAGDDQYTEYD